MKLSKVQSDVLSRKKAEVIKSCDNVCVHTPNVCVIISESAIFYNPNHASNFMSEALVSGYTQCDSCSSKTRLVARLIL